MLSLAIWAQKHPWPARFFIAATHLFLAVAGVEGGLWLFANGLVLPAFVFYLLLGGFSLAYLAYPYVRPGGLEALLQFRRRKILDATLIACIGLMWLAAGNMLPAKLHHSWVAGAAASPQPLARAMLQAGPEAREQAGLTQLYRSGKTAARWLARHTEQRLDRYKPSGSNDTVGIIVLGVLLTIIIGLLAAAFACALSCAGNDGAAVLVVVFGAGLIAGIWILFVKWMRRVRGRP